MSCQASWMLEYVASACQLGSRIPLGYAAAALSGICCIGMEPSEQDASRASQIERNDNKAVGGMSPRSSETESEPRPKRQASAAALGSPKRGAGHARQKRSSEGGQQHSHGSYKKVRESREPVHHAPVPVHTAQADVAQVRAMVPDCPVIRA